MRNAAHKRKENT